jgi:hypothetical protein
MAVHRRDLGQRHELDWVAFMRQLQAGNREERAKRVERRVRADTIAADEVRSGATKEARQLFTKRAATGLRKHGLQRVQPKGLSHTSSGRPLSPSGSGAQKEFNKVHRSMLRRLPPMRYVDERAIARQGLVYIGAGVLAATAALAVAIASQSQVEDFVRHFTFPFQDAGSMPKVPKLSRQQIQFYLNP